MTQRAQRRKKGTRYCVRDLLASKVQCWYKGKCEDKQNVFASGVLIAELGHLVAPSPPPVCSSLRIQNKPTLLCVAAEPKRALRALCAQTIPEAQPKLAAQHPLLEYPVREPRRPASTSTTDTLLLHDRAAHSPTPGTVSTTSGTDDKGNRKPHAVSLRHPHLYPYSTAPIVYGANGPRDITECMRRVPYTERREHHEERADIPNPQHSTQKCRGNRSVESKGIIPNAHYHPAKPLQKPASPREGATGACPGSPWAHAGEEDSDLLRFRIVVFVLSFPFLSSSAGRVLGHSGCRDRAVPDARRRPVLRQ
ncbi:hypothetical protein K438DRAFT_1777412 [Mycena galopus ATCC 62051]|nr:hypothetical protein K438DRAFT_1777412 [Mycena galopus ATCC 62051]